MRYEVLEHTADVMVKCRGKTLEECFENAAYALSDQTVDATKVEAKDMFSVDVKGGDDEERLYAFLSEILFLQDAEYYAFSEFRVTIDGERVTAQIYGEPLDVKKHRAKTEVKAITYHMMKVDPSVPELTVVFDI